jgi:iron(III) transport system permease protein
VTATRLALLSLLLVVIGVPLFLPACELIADPQAFSSLTEFHRTFGLAKNTLYLVAGTLFLSLPAGTALAALLYRTDLPLRRTYRFVILWTLFVPLPLFASGWQTVLGSGGYLPLAWWNRSAQVGPAFSGPAGPWSPWGAGIGSAIWIHAVAGLPWVVLLVGQGLRWVERDLEEDALTVLPPWRVFLGVTLVRSVAAIGAAALWVSLLTATEITVTDVMQVRTFAEEVYSQLVGPETDPTRGNPVGRAVAVNLPFVAGVALLVLATAWRWERRLPARATLATPPLIYPLGRWRVPLAVAAATVAVLLFVLPLVSLVGRAGWTHEPNAPWSAHILLRELAAVSRTEWSPLGGSLLLAVATGVVCVGMALPVCWLALDAPWFRWVILALMAAAWAMPGPLVGLGLKWAIQLILNLTGSPMLAELLYHGPSALPVLWADMIRFFPCAVAVTWPVLRLMPRELRDAAAVDGAPPVRAFARVIVPLGFAAGLRAALAVGVLSLGELSAGKLVSTPGWPTYAEMLFTQMHYGVTNDLAARCLLLLLAVGLGGLLVLVAAPQPDRHAML